MPGSIPDASVHMHFNYATVSGKKKRSATCKRCFKWSNAQNTTRQKIHLLRCPRYLEWKRVNKNPAEKEVQENLFKFKTQMDPQRKARIDQKIAYAIYVSGKPFTLFEDQVWQDVFNEFRYTPPSAFKISTSLLQEDFKQTKLPIVSLLSKSHSMTLITDESTNVCLNRMINYSVVTEDGDSIYWKTVEAPAAALTSQRLAEGVVDTASEITNGDIQRIRALATDTCPRMLAVHDIIHTIPKTKHMFTVLCTSHSLQLLISDILSLPSVEEFWKLTLSIAHGI
jgi:hypothetical protein